MSFLGHQYIKYPDHREPEGNYSYICAHCDRQVNGLVVAYYYGGVKWLLCTHCGEGSVYTRGQVYPSASFGTKIEGLPEGILKAYEEARNCMSVRSHTACELICRKILMHVAVDKGAEEGKSFAEYLNKLEAMGYITPPMKDWVDLIRFHGNLATHVLEEPDQRRAESTLIFTAEMLRIVYEMDYLGKRYTAHKENQR